MRLRSAPAPVPEDTEKARLRAELDAARATIARLESRQDTAGTLDGLTGLLTPEAFFEAGRRELERSKRSGGAVSLALFDIDGFRALNAAEGTACGDAALVALADDLRGVTRANDVVGRTGADEVAVLMPETDLEGALTCARRAVDGATVQTLPGGGGMAISAGAATHARGGSVESLLNRAATGLDRARRAGGSRVEAALQLVDDHAAPSADTGSQADVVEALAATLLERDRCTGEHSRSVVRVARGVALAFGLPAVDVERISAAALLHDIGKVAIPDHILNKPGALDDAEWDVMRQHPIVGERILRAIPGLGAIAHLIRHEHEHFDGTGYPDRLAGEQIPLGSRIVLACDTYHSMTSDRPYRSRLTHADAIHELARCAGTQFDPRVTEILISHVSGLRQVAGSRVA